MLEQTVTGVTLRSYTAQHKDTGKFDSNEKQITSEIIWISPIMAWRSVISEKNQTTPNFLKNGFSTKRNEIGFNFCCH